jgi:hypothetical protein
MTTIAFGVKRKLRDAVANLLSEGGPLEGVEVDYAFPNGAGKKEHIYFGGVRTIQSDDVTDGQNDTIVREAATVTLYIRVVKSNGDNASDAVEAAEGRAEEIGDAFGAWLGGHREFAGQGSHAAMSLVAGDYSQTDTEVVAVVAYAITVTAYISLTQQV